MESKAAFFGCGSCGTVGHSTQSQAEADFEDASSRLKVWSPGGAGESKKPVDRGDDHSCDDAMKFVLHSGNLT